MRQARRLGFLVEDIPKLLALWQDQSRASAEVKSIALEHVAELDRRIAELTGMRDTLAYLANHCHGDERPDCPILSNDAPQMGERRRRGRNTLRESSINHGLKQVFRLHHSEIECTPIQQAFRYHNVKVLVYN